MNWHHPSGGLGYHWRAWRFKDRFWKPYTAQVSGWIRDCMQGVEGTPILIGPSAGHSLPHDLFKNSAQLIVYEPDQLARRSLSRRARSLQSSIGIQWKNEFPISGTANVLNLNSMLNEMELLPRGPVLFCNCLGQISTLHPIAFSTQDQIPPDFGGRPILSYHDRISVDFAQFSHKDFQQISNLQSLEPLQSNRQLSNRELLNEFILPLLPQDPNEKIEINDHETYHLFSTQACVYFVWQMTPSRIHVIEGVFQTPSPRILPGRALEID